MDVPAQNLEAEQAVLGSMLIEHQAVQKALNHLKPEDFYLDTHREIFAVMRELLARDGKAGIDMVTVGAVLRGVGKLDSVGGMQYLSDCQGIVGTAGHVEHYATIVKKCSLSRQVDAQLIRLANDKTSENMRELGDLIGDLYGSATDCILDFRKDLNAAIEALLDKKRKPIMTGFAGLDAVICGVERQELWTVGARTSGGKTAMMTRLMVNFGLADVPCLYITTEMTAEQMVGRILPMASGVPAWKFRRRVVKEEEHKQIFDACADSLSLMPIYIYGRSRVGVDEIRSAIIRTKPAVVFVDYLQRCKYPRGDNRVYQIEDFMVELKTLTQDLNVVTFLGAQLDRALDKTPSAMPTLSDLRGSGAIEHESDGVLLLWKPTDETLRKDVAYVPPPGNSLLIRAVVAKGRNCAAGAQVDFDLDTELVKFSEHAVARHEEDGYREERWSGEADAQR